MEKQEKNQISIEPKEEKVILKINPLVYDINVIYTTAYSMLDDYYIHLDGDPEKEIIVSIKPKQAKKPNEDYNKDNMLENIAREFENELIKYAFYKKQDEQSTGIKVMMLKKILSLPDEEADIYAESKEYHDQLKEESRILDPESWMDNIEEDIDEIEDPEGIAIPWEEKYGENKEEVEKKEDKSNDK